LGSAHTASSGRCMMDCILRAGRDIGKDVVRGDVQSLLFGGVEESVSRLVKLSDVAMITQSGRWVRARTQKWNGRGRRWMV
jgi:hypothetical protein